MRFSWKLAAFAAILGFPLTAIAADLSREDVKEVFKSLKGAAATLPPLAMQDENGNLVNLGAPRSAVFGVGGEAQPAAKSAFPLSPEDLALEFMTEHATAFGMASPKLRIVPSKVQRDAEGANVKFDQYYAGLPVFGARINVNLNEDGAVKSVTTGALRDTEVFDKGIVSLTPRASSAKAKTMGVSAVQRDYPDQAMTASSADLAVYDPGMLAKQGKPRLVWRFRVKGAPSSLIHEQVLADAHTAEVLLRYSLVAQAKMRKIYDGRDSLTVFPPGYRARFEGDLASSVTDVNNAYDYLGDTYDFYYNNYGRDSFDNKGVPLGATVRFCSYSYGCPMRNAFFAGDADVDLDKGARENDYTNRMYFGRSFVTDDVAAHELTHAVTAYSSQLIYSQESGALSEMMSDVFGEAVDQVNGKGNDAPSVKWVMGEDIPYEGYTRDLADPTKIINRMYDWSFMVRDYPMPDRYLGPGWYDGWQDRGGVHHNCSVGSKAFFLLSDGQEFNNHFVSGIGLLKAARIFYATQVKYLVPSSQYYDLGFSLVQAATDQNPAIITDEDVFNVYQACYAVQILKNSYNNMSFAEKLPSCRVTPRAGSNAVTVTWTNPSAESGYAYTAVVRKMNEFVYSPYDPSGQVVYTGAGQRFVDNLTVAGSEYYYSVFAFFGNERRGYSQRALNHVVAGTHTPDHLSEAFSFFAPVDLAQKQITFAPIGDPRLAAASKRPEDYVNYSNYAGSSIDYPSSDLPVTRGNAILVNPSEDGFVQIPTLPIAIPFMGNEYASWIIAANGYIMPTVLFQQFGLNEYSAANFTPTYLNHYSIPRISPLFADLSPEAGGQVWYKVLPDKLVVTWENIREYGRLAANTFQAEIFFSGHIRFTYADVNARNAVAGISDGRGVPQDPVIAGKTLMSDLSELPAPSVVTLDPIPVQYSEEQQRITFTARASAPVGRPVITMSGLPMNAVYRQNGDGSATFDWTPGFNDSGSLSVFVMASLGPESASQYVKLVVADKHRLPVANNLTLFPEDPTDDDMLEGDFSSIDLDSIATGEPSIYWFRNNAWAPAFQDRRTLPASATRVGDKWYFVVVLRSANNLAGSPVQSPIRTIGAVKIGDFNKDGAVDAVDVQMAIHGALRLSDLKRYAADVNKDGVTDALDVQMVINSALGLYR